MTVPPPIPLAGIVLVGGQSRRMGRDKATLSVPEALGGRTLVEHLVDVVGQRCTPVLVMAARGQTLPELPAQLLRDEVAGLGPLPAVGRGLQTAAAGGAEYAFVCAVDMPLLTAELIDTLADAAARVDADVVLPWDGRDHYLAAVYRTRLAPGITALVAAGERRMGALVNTVDAQRIVVPQAPTLANVNSPADLQALLPR
ncbi:molybdenum cofactor guanylyltransferase [Mycobacterium sp. pUA109]|uniref:molybdenum cofactor guanylyltransferase n=1 Tax=Mycobacterium sp. pUA109 TaxID=3238982 RepID=UPI00351AF2DA